MGGLGIVLLTTYIHPLYKMTGADDDDDNDREERDTMKVGGWVVGWLGNSTIDNVRTYIQKYIHRTLYKKDDWC